MHDTYLAVEFYSLMGAESEFILQLIGFYKRLGFKIVNAESDTQFTMGRNLHHL